MKGLAERARERGHLMVESHRPVLFVRVPLEVALAATAAASVRGRHSDIAVCFRAGQAAPR